MVILHSLAAVALAALLAAGSVRPAAADALAQPLPASHPTAAKNLAKPVSPAKPGAARPGLSNSLAQPVQADAKPSCPCAAPPAFVVEAAPDGTAITGDLSHMRPSDRLLGREQALRAHFGQQIHSGERPWLPVADDN